MISGGVCAVLISFRPQPSVAENISALRPQVSALVIVDNGSPPENLASMKVAAQRLKCTLIEQGTNLGIAAALNHGIRWAMRHGFRYVVLLDQDSTVTPGFVTALWRTYQNHPQPQRVAVVTPSQFERGTSQRRGHRYASDGGPLVAITSGSFMPMQVFERCGWFDEALVIDCVDHDYCLRARLRGYTIAHSQDALLRVSVGSTRRHRLLGIEINASHHNAKRRYYITRNRIVMVRRFWRHYPIWCCRALMDIARDTVALAFVEEDRRAKLSSTRMGLAHALSGMLGKRVDL